ncbi:hypothetical protein ACFOSC_21210 [Streptantibioticus rubrisoli]|uniref:Uncharacterized protein n=1 Tax=Streptantibioticus rubrisoli TaxID=1387313 RepID=A0ABT1P540_9ACTN|nr:hypothetical protein [Streptantibioticus rubrisoli]MCQ4040481.1 hypothetical protein [Streptantibioticus rubrisoli]
MQFSNEEPPSHEVRTVAWARRALGRRIAVLANEPMGLIGYAAGSLPDGSEETWEIHVRYPRAEVKTLRHPSSVRPGVTTVDLLIDAVASFSHVPDLVTEADVEEWLTAQATQPPVTVEDMPEAMRIDGTPYRGVQAERDDVTARLVQPEDGTAVVVVGESLGAVRLLWA